jgi:hypothetical protein
MNIFYPDGTIHFILPSPLSLATRFYRKYPSRTGIYTMCGDYRLVQIPEKV